MLLPLFIIVAVVNIVAKNNNYYIKTPRNPDFDVRVKRDAGFSELENERNEYSVILNELNELIKIYIDTDFDKKVKREVDRDKNIDSDENISGEVTELKNNTKVWKEIASVADEIKVLLTEFDLKEKPKISIRVRRVADNAKIKENDVGTSVGVTELNNNIRLVKYKKSISDIKEPRERQPDSRAKRKALQWNYNNLGLVDTLIFKGTKLFEDNIELKDKSLLQIPLENVGLSPKGTNTEQMVPKNNITPKYKQVKERLSKKQEEELNLKKIEMEDVLLKDKLKDGLFNEPVKPDHIAEKILYKEHYRENIPRQEKLEINKDEIEKISENLHTDIPEKPIEKFDTESIYDVGKVNIGFKKEDYTDTNKRCHEFKNFDEMKTLKILKAFDDIDGLLEIDILESSIEEEQIKDDKVVLKHTESGQEYQLVVDYTEVREPNDVSNCVTPKIKKIRYKTNIEREKPKKSLLKTITNKEQNKIIIDNSLKLTDSEKNLFKPVYSEKDNNKKLKRGTFLKILNKNRVKREASPGNSVSKFFSNIYTKIYDMTHPKKDKDDNSDLLVRDDSYNSYGNMYQQYNNNNNQNRGNNQFEKNRINDNKLTHSDYTYIDNNYNNYGNGYGSTNNAYSYKPTQGSGYDYNTGYGSNNYNAKPDNGYSYNTGNGYNTTQNHGYRYNATDFNNKGTSTEQTIVQGCIFCGNYGCQKNYKWMGVACVPIKRKK